MPWTSTSAAVCSKGTVAAAAAKLLARSQRTMYLGVMSRMERVRGGAEGTVKIQIRWHGK
jgi:hypothetical protein